MTKMQPSYGPIDVLKLAGEMLGTPQGKLEKEKQAVRQFIHTRLKAMGRKEGKNYVTSKEGALAIINENINYFERKLGVSHETRQRRLREASAGKELRDTRERFLKEAPQEWLAAHQQLQLEAETRPDEPHDEQSDPTSEYLAFEAQARAEFEALAGISEDNLLRFMIRALFFEQFGDFDLKKLNEDYISRGQLRGLLSQHPGIGPDWVSMKIREKELTQKVDEALEGRNLFAYMPKGKRTTEGKK